MKHAVYLNILLVLFGCGKNKPNAVVPAQTAQNQVQACNPLNLDSELILNQIQMSFVQATKVQPSDITGYFTGRCYPLEKDYPITSSLIALTDSQGNPTGSSNFIFLQNYLSQDYYSNPMVEFRTDIIKLEIQEQLKATTKTLQFTNDGLLVTQSNSPEQLNEMWVVKNCGNYLTLRYFSKWSFEKAQDTKRPLEPFAYCYYFRTTDDPMRAFTKF